MAEKDELARLSALLLELHRGALFQSVEGFADWAFDTLKRHIPFDSGLWASGHVDPDGTPVVHSHRLYRQPAQLMLDYAPLARHDNVFAASLMQPGVSLAVDTRVFAPAVFGDYLDRYRIEHVLNTCDVDPFTGLLDDIALWRAERDQPFVEAERRFMQAVFPHLIEASTRNRLAHLTGTCSAGTGEVWSAALADRLGVLRQADSRFASMLRQEWPDWCGPHLPPPLARALAPGGLMRHAGEHLVIRIAALEDLWLLRVRPLGEVDRLTAREREIALHTAQGLSHKEIARLLELSPATVRNHLASACRRMGVRNKAQLAALVLGHE